METLGPKTTDLVLIDLEHAVVGRELAPWPGKGLVATNMGVEPTNRVARRQGSKKAILLRA